MHLDESLCNDNEMTMTLTSLYLGTRNNVKNCIMEETMVLIMLVSNTWVCHGDFISTINATKIIR